MRGFTSLILGKRKIKLTEGRKVGRARETKPPPPHPLVQGLEPPYAAIMQLNLETDTLVLQALCIVLHTTTLSTALHVIN